MSLSRAYGRTIRRLTMDLLVFDIAVLEGPAKAVVTEEVAFHSLGPRWCSMGASVSNFWQPLPEQSKVTCRACLASPIRITFCIAFVMSSQVVNAVA